MDRETVIKIAMDCGMLVTQSGFPTPALFGSGGGIDIERFAAAVAAAVKEEAAAACDLAVAQCDETAALCQNAAEELVIRGARLQAEKLGRSIRASIKEAKS